MILYIIIKLLTSLTDSDMSSSTLRIQQPSRTRAARAALTLLIPMLMLIMPKPESDRMAPVSF